MQIFGTQVVPGDMVFEKKPHALSVMASWPVAEHWKASFPKHADAPQLSWCAPPEVDAEQKHDGPSEPKPQPTSPLAARRRAASQVFMARGSAEHTAQGHFGGPACERPDSSGLEGLSRADLEERLKACLRRAR